MAKIITKTIPWVTITFLFGLVILGGLIILKEVRADTATPTVIVGNAAPSLGTVTLNGGASISVAEQSYATVIAVASVTDSNGYSDLKYSTATLYHSATTCGPSRQDANWCYYASGTPSCATSSCSGNSCHLTCTFTVWFVAIPTDASSSYAANNWKVEIKATDNSNGSTTGSSTQELTTTSFVLFTPSWNYGTIAPVATSSEINTKATNTGNHYIDIELSGGNMTSTALDEIEPGQQKYSTNSDMDDWVGTALTTSPASFDIVCPKGTATTVPNSADDVYWMIKIPDAQPPGTYNGTDSITITPTYGQN